MTLRRVTARVTHNYVARQVEQTPWPYSPGGTGRTEAMLVDAGSPPADLQRRRAAAAMTAVIEDVRKRRHVPDHAELTISDEPGERRLLLVWTFDPDRGGGDGDGDTARAVSRLWTPGGPR